MSYEDFKSISAGKQLMDTHKRVMEAEQLDKDLLIVQAVAAMSLIASTFNVEQESLIRLLETEPNMKELCTYYSRTIEVFEETDHTNNDN